MANNPKGLGKGLAALLGDDVIDSQEEKSSLFLPISQVESCASQPRNPFDPAALAAYDVSPMHHRWKDRFGPLLEKKAIFDFEE